MLEHASGALFLDPGLGKTSITLSAIRVLRRRKLLRKVLVIAPLRVCHQVWPTEGGEWRNFNDLKMVVLHGKDKDRLLKSDADIYIINPEGLDWLLGTNKVKTPSGKKAIKVDARRFKELGFDTLVIDELSKFKNTNSDRFKALKQVQHTFARKWGLTGSPASNGLLNLFGQCYILDGGRTFGPYITHFRKKYFENPPHNQYEWRLRQGAEDEIYEAVSPLALRMSDDLIDMPELVERQIQVELPQKAMEAYKKLEDDMMIRLENGDVSAVNSGVLENKLRQVTGGAIYLDADVEALIKLPTTKKDWVELHSAKLDALEELIEELQGAPLLVAYEFSHEIERIKNRFGKNVPYIGGGVSSNRSKELEVAWNSGELPVLFGHPASIGHGLNLQKAGNHIAWLTPTWDYELYDQFNRRVYRQGNKSKTVFVHRLIVQGTVDKYVLMKLRNKGRTQESLFSALTKLREENGRY